MDVEFRAAVTSSLIRLASSSDYRDRADAGLGLSRFLDQSAAVDVIVSLVLDRGDTWVTLQVARALLGREDSAGLSTLAMATSSADENHMDYIAHAVHEILGIYSRVLDQAATTCAELAVVDDQRVRRGAAVLATIIGGINPVLKCVDP
jgi:hypothetical protein